MARKGQSYRKYDSDFRNKILSEYKEGYSAEFLGNKYGVSSYTIKTWLRKQRQGYDVNVRIPGSGRKKSNPDYKERYEILKKFQAFLEKRREKK